MTKIDIRHVEPDPLQPRKAFDQTALNELAASIKSRGLIQPITVCPAGKHGRFIILTGERRWRAHKLLAAKHRKFTKIAANVTTAPKRERRLAQLVENMQRADMTPLEEANAFKALVDDGMTTDQIASELGLAEFRVSWRLQLLNLAPEPRKLFEAGQLDRQQALELSRLDAPRDQTRVLRLINRGDLNGWKAVRNAVDAINTGMTQADIFGPVAPKPKAEDVATLTAMEKKIEQVIAMVGHGWKNGECIVAAKVNLDRAKLMADRLAAIQKALRIMERELRNVTAQGQIVLSNN
jgi:ParB family chromosome partitioning protein